MSLGIVAVSAQEEKKDEKKSVSAPVFTDHRKLLWALMMLARWHHRWSDSHAR